jgi:murein DD-endopeptidase MepM/ murein hydrolase activator NlpD
LKVRNLILIFSVLLGLLLVVGSTSAAVESQSDPEESPTFSYLKSPLKNNPYSDTINAVFDHNMSTFYGVRDGEVVAYTGETGKKSFDFDSDFPTGYKNEQGSNFVINGHYSGNKYLYYDDHPGIDYRAYLGTEIYAAEDGFISQPDKDSVNGDPSGLNTVKIDHGNGYSTWYLHSSEIIRTSGYVKRGELIAKSGGAGGFSPHLHFEVRYNDIPIDPYGWEGEGKDVYSLAVNENLWIPKDKALLKMEDKPDVYWLQNNKLYPVTEDAMNDMSAENDWGWDNINSFPKATFEINKNKYKWDYAQTFIALGEESNGVLIREIDDTKVYLIKNGERHWIPTEEVFENYIFKFEDVIDVSEGIISKIPDGAPLSTEKNQSLDLIFLIDTTGSMVDDIDNVKASASEIVEAIDSKNYDYRVSVAEYRDIPLSPYGSSGDYVYKLDCSFSNDKDEIIAAINSISVAGGADWQESVYSGLVYAMTDKNKDLANSDNYGWRQGVTKQIILMGDAPAHDPEPWEGGYTLEDVVYWSENIDPIIVQSIRIGSNSETLSSFTKISSSTAGKVYTSPTADEIVDTIIEVIGDIGSTPSIDIELSVNGEDSDTPPGSYLLKGDNVTWTYSINNTGTVSLEDIEIIDDNMDLICSIDSLLPGESSSCTVEESVECGQQGKNIFVSINYTSTDGEIQVTDEDSSFYFGACPDLKLDKFTNGYDADSTPGIQVGDSVKWNYVITNTGNVPLTNLSLMDDKEGIIPCLKDTLEVGDSIECEHIGVVEYGYYENIANIIGEFNGFEVYAEDKGVYYGYEEGDDWAPVAVPTANPIITAAALGIFIVLFLRRENK